MYTYSFEKLEVWQRSREFVKAVYLITREFPAEEKFGVNSQLRRSAISVSSNIAEGCTRWSNKDKARFYEIAFGSLMENLNQLIVAHDLNYISETDLAKMRLLIDESTPKTPFYYKLLQNPISSSSGKIFPQRSYGYACGIFSPLPRS